MFPTRRSGIYASTFQHRHFYSCVDPTVNKPCQTTFHRKSSARQPLLSGRGFQRPAERSVAPPATAPVAQHAPADASPVHGDTLDPHTHRAKMLAIGASSRVAAVNVAAPARAVTSARSSSSTGAKAAQGAVPMRASFALAASRRTRVGGARRHGLTSSRASPTRRRRRETRATRASPPAWAASSGPSERTSPRTSTSCRGRSSPCSSDSR